MMFRAGVAAVDVSPLTFPVIINGAFTQRTATRIVDPVMSRALVLDDGKTRLAIVVVDNLMIPRVLLDDVKRVAAARTGIPVERMLISATHTHSAPSAMHCLGSRPDLNYLPVLSRRIVESIVQAAENSVPAEIGWAVTRDEQHNTNRRFILRPDLMAVNPFGERTIRADAHTEHRSPGVSMGKAGPSDPDLSLLALRTRDGRPLAVLGNYAMHFIGGTPAVSADFCGAFGTAFAKLIDAPDGNPAFVGMMSQGTSGDVSSGDVNAAGGGGTAYTRAVASRALEAYQEIEFRPHVELAMAEAKLTLRRRVPNAQRLAWARDRVAALNIRLPTSKPDIYAVEAISLHEQPEVELKLQAIRIGRLGITALPNEVYAITGLKLKAQSPLQPTFNIELANGNQGYLPPPEQHALGGYSTHPARHAGLVVEAEPKIVDTLLRLLEQVSGKKRRPAVDYQHAYARAVVKSKPAAFWRLGEIAGDRARDSVGGHHARYEHRYALFLAGAAHKGLAGGPRGNRAVQIVGGRVKATAPALADIYTVEMWFWNALPTDNRAITGYLFSRGADGKAGAPGDHFGIGGTFMPEAAGRLIVYNGDEANTLLVGKTSIAPRTWNHVAFLRNGDRVQVFLNGNTTPEIDGRVAATFDAQRDPWFLGGRSDDRFNFEGRLDEVALYDRALTADEIAAHCDVAVERQPEAPPPHSTSLRK
ncbi:neutral/alkaline non-lysosomal ceramidase N-terminal domain-containing protein [Pirellulales bacterium]|nr:neutral/alkaline non-lysosomal ceramidase N-terminal domain-containing protein [Pirellulales bacterium]